VPPSVAGGSGPKIQHVVIVVQENRSFDNLFQGFPGADTVSVAHDAQLGDVPLRPMSMTAAYDVSHLRPSALLAIDGGKMDGFSQEPAGPTAPHNPMFVFVPQAQVARYFAMAKAGALADRFFSQLDGSFVAHQYLIAGQAGNATGVPALYPWGCDSPASNSIAILTPGGEPNGRVYPCFDYTTLGDELSANGVTWRYYSEPVTDVGAYNWSAYDAIRHIRTGGAWQQHIVAPAPQFLADVAAGTLSSVTWVTPSGINSDHPASKSASGPVWVSSIVDAVGRSKFWSTSVVLVLWDDWGGMYDHVAPPPAVDVFGPGIRVPLLVVSPYAARGSVAHTTYTFGSVLRFVEDTFGVGRLTDVDAKATPFGTDLLNLQQAPQPYPGPFGTPAERRRLLGEPPSTEPPDTE
jgi:phospholipase C